MDVLESLEQECYQTLLEPMVDAGLVPETQEQDSFKLLRRIKK
jgi:hypothetical protein